MKPRTLELVRRVRERTKQFRAGVVRAAADARREEEARAAEAAALLDLEKRRLNEALREDGRRSESERVRASDLLVADAFRIESQRRIDEREMASGRAEERARESVREEASAQHALTQAHAAERAAERRLSRARTERRGLEERRADDDSAHTGENPRPKETTRR